MAPPKLTDYERKRLENIRRNNEMMAALKVQSKAAQLSNHTKYSSSLFLFYFFFIFFLSFYNFFSTK
jgi:hypothetical protein